ncbi:long-chain fatty acid--CoA ligase [Acidipila sp. EB88]|uniref:AMP-dependent synthetase/ligase n=1 Tax=Acidipila sp. EB88 TaxID=2305226 RepID=UPI000F5EDF76|nr:long-chain fatty acid--CoA ligase [Acidipila sp. EB88]RRA49743.1 long-chain fatty acid--CoA ligase [Acidipila sp. EB88]
MATENAPNYQTVNDIFYKVADSGSADVVRVLERNGAWLILSAAELYARVRALAHALTSLGLGKGDRVAILSENRAEWAITDFATLATGMVNVPLFPTLHAPQIGDLLQHSGCRVAVVSTKVQLRKVLSVLAQTRLEHIIVMDDVKDEIATLAGNSDTPGGSAEVPSILSFGALIAERTTARDTAFDAAAHAITGSDLGSIIYTSGTTGEPKGVMLTHGNLASNVSYALREFMPFSGPQRTVSFLPLSHVTARHADYDLYSLGFSMAYCPSMDKLMSALKTVKPTLIVAVPRVFEKVRQEVERRSRGSKLSSAVVRWALGVGRRNESTILAGRTPRSPLWKLADKLFYSKVRAVFGGEVLYFVAGGAPLGGDTAHWFAQAGIRILEGYGLTETSPVIGVNTPVAYRLGTIGKPLPNLQVRLAEDGELLVKGPSVFKGYWESPGLTAQAFDSEGWFLTGDIASQDADGFLTITDRKKELIKTSAGKFIAPQAIEGKLAADLFVASAAVFGDREKYVAALIAPNFEVLEAWAREQKIVAASRQELIRNPAVIARYKETIKQVNRGLADYELLKNFALVADEWTIDSGELTPSMKLKRRVLKERYQVEIASLFHPG